MEIYEKTIEINPPKSDQLFSSLRNQLEAQLHPGESLIRLAVIDAGKDKWICDVGISREFNSEVLTLRKRSHLNDTKFNVVMTLPTGLGCEFGGHAGDGAPVAKLLARNCDNLILHPNVVNGSDINEMPTNSLYVEGSLLSQLMMGQISLQPVRGNRVLVLIEGHENKLFENSAINSVNAAAACYGLEVPEIIVFNSGYKMDAQFSKSGRASGRISGMSEILNALENRRGDYDAVAITSRIGLEGISSEEYLTSFEDSVNPWGGVESILTHAMSLQLGVPCAHSPMYHNEEEALMDPGVVDPRKASEVISWSFLQCILKGLQKSPQILPPGQGSFAAENISCLVQPDGCVGIPTLAALAQGITVIAVANKNAMDNDLDSLPWRPGQLIRSRNYFEASGILQALQGGIALASLQRPLRPATTTVISSEEERPSVNGLPETIL